MTGVVYSHYLSMGLHATVYHLWIRNGETFVVRKYHEIIDSRIQFSKSTSKYIDFANCFNLNRYIFTGQFQSAFMTSRKNTRIHVYFSSQQCNTMFRRQTLLSTFPAEYFSFSLSYSFKTRDKKYRFFPQMNVGAGSFPSATGAQPATCLMNTRSSLFENIKAGA